MRVRILSKRICKIDIQRWHVVKERRDIQSDRADVSNCIIDGGNFWGNNSASPEGEHFETILDQSQIWFRTDSVRCIDLMSTLHPLSFFKNLFQLWSRLKASELGAGLDTGRRLLGRRSNIQTGWVTCWIRFSLEAGLPRGSRSTY
jgi:hypothetical protein